MEDPVAPTAELALEIELAFAEASEEVRVRSWRLDQFLGLGFEPATSSVLASSKADIGQARRLIERGCTPELAARILV